jgi:hypothetical protein
MFCVSETGRSYHTLSCRYTSAFRTFDEAPPGYNPCKVCIPAVFNTEGAIVVDTEGRVYVTQIAAVDLETGRFFYAKMEGHTRYTVDREWLGRQREPFLKFIGNKKQIIVHNTTDISLLNSCFNETNGEDFFPKDLKVIDSVPFFRRQGKQRNDLGSVVKRIFGTVKKAIGSIREDELNKKVENYGRLHNALVDAALTRQSILSVLRNMEVVLSGDIKERERKRCASALKGVTPMVPEINQILSGITFGDSETDAESDDERERNKRDDPNDLLPRHSIVATNVVVEDNVIIYVEYAGTEAKVEEPVARAVIEAKPPIAEVKTALITTVVTPIISVQPIVVAAETAVAAQARVVEATLIKESLASKFVHSLLDLASRFAGEHHHLNAPSPGPGVLVLPPQTRLEDVGNNVVQTGS